MSWWYSRCSNSHVKPWSTVHYDKLKAPFGGRRSKLFEKPTRHLNRVQLFDEPVSCLEAQLKVIDKARHRIWAETYCIDGSPRSRLVVDRLRAAANRGVDVVLSVDWMGIFGYTSALREHLRGSRVNLVVFNPLWNPIAWPFYRNHRKVLICDDVGFIGSMNYDVRSLGSPAADPNNPATQGNATALPLRPADFNQTVRLEGRVVHDLARSFCEVLAKSRLPLKRDADEVKFQYEVHGPTPKGAVDACDVCLLRGDGRRQKQYVRALRTAIQSAKNHLLVSSSYFHPPRALQAPLVKALRRGVESILVLSGKSDVPFDAEATLAILPYFLVGKLNRCRSFFIGHRHCHTKTVTIDRRLAFIGSLNWDWYSVKCNLEAGVRVKSSKFTQLVNQSIEKQLFMTAVNGQLDKDSSSNTLGAPGVTTGVAKRSQPQPTKHPFHKQQASTTAVATGTTIPQPLSLVSGQQRQRVLRPTAWEYDLSVSTPIWKRIFSIVSYHVVRAAGASIIDRELWQPP